MFHDWAQAMLFLPTFFSHKELNPDASLKEMLTSADQKNTRVFRKK